MSRVVSVIALTLAGVALACGDPSGIANVRYELRSVDGHPVPAARVADSAEGYYDYVDSAAVEIVDDTTAWVSLATHQVRYLSNGDSLMGGWQFRARARIQQIQGGLILDYRSRLFQPPYGSDFMGLDTATIVRTSLVILGDSLFERPRTVYRYTP